MKIRLVLGFLLLLGYAFATGSSADDWPQWRGPNRDGQSAETGLLKEWPVGGPRLIRQFEGIGEGFSHPIIVGERIYVSGKTGGDLRLFCFMTSGETVWEATNGKAFMKSAYVGARGIPTFDQDMLFHLSGCGRLAAYDASTGREIWHRDALEDFEGRSPVHGYAESVLVYGDTVIFSPQALDATIAALDKRSGETLWKVGGLNHEKVYPEGHDGTYTSSISFNCEGIQNIATLTNKALFGLSPGDGHVLWRFDQASNSEKNIDNCATPGFHDGYLFAFQGDGHGGGVASLSKNSQGDLETNLIWETLDMMAEHGGYVLVDGFLYGNHDKKGWSCIDFKSGETRWIEKGIGNGSIICAEGLLYCYGERGTMALVEPTPEEFRIVSSFEIPNPGNQNWAHPAISDGRLYLRHEDKLYVYDISE